MAFLRLRNECFYLYAWGVLISWWVSIWRFWFILRRAIEKTLIELGKKNGILEGDSANAFKWASGLCRPHWRLVNVVRKGRDLANGLGVSFSKIGRSANGVVDLFAKLGVDDQAARVFFFFILYFLALFSLVLFLFPFRSNPSRPSCCFSPLSFNENF